MRDSKRGAMIWGSVALLALLAGGCDSSDDGGATDTAATDTAATDTAATDTAATDTSQTDSISDDSGGGDTGSSDTDTGGDDLGTVDAGGDSATEPDVVDPDTVDIDTGGEFTCEPEAVECEDESFLQLALKDTVAPGLIQNEKLASGWLSTIDATAGGFSPSESFVYARFTDDGLLRLPMSDETAIEDVQWQIAFRRFLVRLNSGVSGPSCVSGAPLIAFDFDGVTSLPPGVTTSEEAYFTGACTLIDDGSGLGSAKTVLSSFWTYTDCVAMTNQIFAIHLDDGRWVKAQIESYYAPDIQEMCQNGEGTPQGATGAGMIRLRWDLLPE